MASLAALFATAGDFVLLFVANQRPELALPSTGRAWLWVGGSMGVLAIPFYALGYRSASRIVAEVAVRPGKALFVAGLGTAVLGSVIHGVTAAQIAADLAAGATHGDPLSSLLATGGTLFLLWGLAALLVTVASTIFFWFVARGTTSAPRSAALASPALATLVIALLALPFAALRPFLIPAAPNLAHLAFFLVCFRLSRRAPRVPGRAA